MRPASLHRRHSAIALVFAAWCAAYGLPAELVRDLTAQTVGFSQFNAVHPGKQAKVLLDRLSTRVRRADQVRLAFFAPLLAPAAAFPSLAGAPIEAAPKLNPPSAIFLPAQSPRPPPPSFSA